MLVKKIVVLAAACFAVAAGLRAGGAEEALAETDQSLRVLVSGNGLLAARSDADEGDEGEDGGSIRSRRSRADEEVSADEEEDTATDRRRSRSETKRSRRAPRRSAYRGARVHRVLPGLVIPGAILMGAGLFLAYDGFRHNPMPSGSTTASYYYYSYYYYGTYYDLYYSGKFTNTGKGGLYATIYMKALSTSYSQLGSFSYYLGSVSEGNSKSWYYYTYDHYYSSAPYYYSVTSSYYDNGEYAMNNVYEGVGGIVGFAVGTALLIVGLTHTEQALSDNGVQFKIYETASRQMAFSASKTF